MTTDQIKAAYACGVTTTPLLRETIAADLERAIGRFGGRDALVDCAQGRRWSYTQFGEAVDELDAAAVRAFCEGRIGRYKVPRYVRLVEGSPVTVTGKVQKFKLREQAIEELGLSTHAAVRTV